LLGQREHVVLGRADERAAALGDLASSELVVLDAAADDAARLEHDDALAGVDELPCGGQPGEACTDDADVGGTGAMPLGPGLLLGLRVGDAGQGRGGTGRECAGDEAPASRFVPA
jgi:hypothetical protein